MKHKLHTRKHKGAAARIKKGLIIGFIALVTIAGISFAGQNATALYRGIVH